MSQQEFNTALIELEPNLERFAYSLTANHEDARDLLQETYLKALTYKDKFEDNTNIKAWTFTIMKNTFINNYRKAVKQNTTFDSSDNQFMINSKSENYGPDSMYSHSEISKKIDALEDDFRLPFQMHTSGYKYKEIADKLNLKIGTVKSRIFFSRQKLMTALKDYE
ncbi:MAG TPA: RNA polymerase sigma factor [Tenuifilaceae bacterium]|nr:RNA polymerase sigma factor [Tenuifilaceae bacterium]HOZ16010.1 RNA polymerase sigma factor [Tenuifilaceae bacterium]HPI45573.1 RNA polymerase sigma factor [Tenuifilaceae bacterium]HPN20680.1 RNA polymerase sigma factor [Tenuifilaceae bacterium]HSA04051.1 RNA polymerase sigma factor [Tenuifilaceae bacterium]